MKQGLYALNCWKIFRVHLTCQLEEIEIGFRTTACVMQRLFSVLPLVLIGCIMQRLLRLMCWLLMRLLKLGNVNCWSHYVCIRWNMLSWWGMTASCGRWFEARQVPVCTYYADTQYTFIPWSVMYVPVVIWPFGAETLKVLFPTEGYTSILLLLFLYFDGHCSDLSLLISRYARKLDSESVFLRDWLYYILKSTCWIYSIAWTLVSVCFQMANFMRGRF